MQSQYEEATDSILPGGCFSYFHVNSAQTHLPPEWVAILEKLCQKFDDAKPDPPVVNRMWSLVSSRECEKPHHLPLSTSDCVVSVEQFNDALPITVKCPKCVLSDDANQPLAAVRQQCGADSERSGPRKIYGTDGVTVFIGRVYKCSRGHEIVGYHPGILKQIPDSLVPFRLWHKTGFTNELNLVCTLITAGMSITNIRTILSKKQISQYCRLKHFQSLKLFSTVEKDFSTLDIWKKCFSNVLQCMLYQDAFLPIFG